MPLPIKVSDIAITTLKVESAQDRRDIDVARLSIRNTAVQLHLDEKTLLALVNSHIGLHPGALLIPWDDKCVTVEVSSITRSVKLILERSQLDDLRAQCRSALGEINFGDLKEFND